MPPSQPPLPLTLPNGEPLPPPPGEDYREHTAERWKETDRPSYDFALWLVRAIGITNQSKITAEVTQHRAERGLPGISRNSVRALFNSAEFKPGEFDEIIRRRSQQSTATAIDKIDEILEAVEKPKDLGAAAMALNTLYNVSQISAGKATRITGTTTDAEKARTFDHYRKLAEAKANALQPPPPPIRDVTPVEVENADLSDQ